MPAETQLLSSVHIKINGSDIPEAMISALTRMEVDCSLHLPGVFRLEFVEGQYGTSDSPSFEWMDNSTLSVGAEVEIQAKANETGVNQPQNVSLLKGFITALDPVFDEDGSARMVVRGSDSLFKLQRGTKTRTYVRQKDSDILSKLVGEHGLSLEMTATSELYEYVLQDDVSDYEFLLHLARRNGFVVVADGRSLKVKAPDALGFPEVILKWGRDLLEFQPTVSIGGQVNSVTVQGWDYKQKQAITGQATSPELVPVEIGLGKRGSALAQEAASAQAKLHVVATSPTVADANKLAQATLNRMGAADIVGEGRCFGNPKVKAGGKLKLQGLGTRFSGVYLVTRVRHYFSPQDAFRTEFWVGGMTSGTLAQLVAPPERPALQHSSAFLGLTPAVVTNTTDPDALGRVKVKFPMLSDTDESAWARVVAPGAGKNRGISMLPAVGDEVLVGFANGDPNQPYVLGGLWNGKDNLPTPQGEAAVNGTTEVSEWKTVSGHYLRFTDKAGSEKIELFDKASNSIVIESSSNEITIDAKGSVFIKAAQNISVKAGSKIELDAAQISVTASAKLSLKAPMVDISGDAKVSVTAPMVMIN